MSNRVHDFQESLSFSHAAEDLPIWEEVYKKAFPDFVDMVSYREDGFWQRQGIDRGVFLKTSKQLRIDEKIRGRNKITGKIYDDICLEYYSSYEANTPGWCCKPLMADYIAYLIAPLGKCYLLPVIQLQSAFAKNRESWIAEYPKIEAENKNYTTVSVGVPTKILFLAMGQELRINFEPFELEDL